MARIRTIKPEFWRNEDLCNLPEATHMLAAALLNYADDFGYFNANPKLIEGEIYPLRKPSVKIPESLRSLQTIGYLELGTTPDGKNWGRVVHFTSHQKVSHPTDSKISCLSITWEHSGNTPENILNPPDPLRPEGKGKEQGKERNARASRFDEFWNVCPKKVGKGKAEKIYLRSLQETSPDLLIAAMRRYAASQAGKDETYIAHPSTWLNDKRWADEASVSAPVGGVPANLAEIQRLEEEARSRMENENVH